MTDIKKAWKVFKGSSMGDKVMQETFQRIATPNVCIELLEENEQQQAKIAELEENSKYVRMGWTNLPQIYYAMQEEGQGAVFADEQLGCRHEVFVTESTWHELQDAIRKQASEL